MTREQLAKKMMARQHKLMETGREKLRKQAMKLALADMKEKRND